jgi:hypothetical protein
MKLSFFGGEMLPPIKMFEGFGSKQIIWSLTKIGISSQMTSRHGAMQFSLGGDVAPNDCVWERWVQADYPGPGKELK